MMIFAALNIKIEESYYYDYIIITTIQ